MDTIHEKAMQTLSGSRMGLASTARGSKEEELVKKFKSIHRKPYGMIPLKNGNEGQAVPNYTEVIRDLAAGKLRMNRDGEISIARAVGTYQKTLTQERLSLAGEFSTAHPDLQKELSLGGSSKSQTVQIVIEGIAQGMISLDDDGKAHLVGMAPQDFDNWVSAMSRDENDGGQPGPGMAAVDEGSKNLGGIDFTPENLDLIINRDERGIPIPLSPQQIEI